MELETKTCIRCGKELPATTDYFFQQKIGVLRSRCKECFGKEYTHKLEVKDGYRVCKKCGKELPETEEHFTLRKDVANPCFRGTCKECRRSERSRHWLDNKEVLTAQNNVYYVKNRDTLLAKEKQRQLENPEKYKLKNKISWVKFKEKRTVENKRWREENREGQKKYREDNAERYRVHYREYYKTPKGRASIINSSQKRRALKKSTIATLTTEQWQESLDFFGNSCAYCEKVVTGLQQEHVIPVDLKGGYTRTNIIPACQSCNSSKQKRTLEVWYPQQPFFSPERLTKIHAWIGFDTKSNTQQLALY